MTLPPELEARITPLDERAIDADGADYVLCWLQQALRANDNPAIDAAIALGQSVGLPVLVYHGLRMDYPHASDRLHRFILGASRDLQRGCEARGLRCATYVETEDVSERGLLYRLAERAAAVVTDEQPVFVAAWQARAFAAKCNRAVLSVDCARLVPTRVLPAGLRSTPEFRKASGVHRDRFLAAPSDFETDRRYEGDLPFGDARNADCSDAELDARVAGCRIDHTLPASTIFPATAAAAQGRLETFIEHHLDRYKWTRNNPVEEGAGSMLSPYLHFGLIGPRQIAQAVKASDAHSAAKWKFVDELLTWREWFHYLCHHAEQPEAFAFVPERPRRSLLDHADDPRDRLYTLSELLHGETEDETWNAAQRQWLATGYMHNNLRMYWGKKIIGWTAHPQEAWVTACYINDRLSLDGRDPATYGNMRWVFGDAKPAYREQEVYGWVAPKTDGALRKRKGVPEWLTAMAASDVPRIAVPNAPFIATGFEKRLLP
ncbi:MAG: deoxyribodipyrimidine photo-lyase [Pseudomonadota bacterium]